MNRTLYVGQSSRTGEGFGLRALIDIVNPFGYTVIPVRVTGCLHLKSACLRARYRIGMNRAWVDAEAMANVRQVELPATEPWGANVLRPLPGVVVVSASFSPRSIWCAVSATPLSPWMFRNSTKRNPGSPA